MATSSTKNVIGTLSACIDGDHRYTSRLEVTLEDGKASIVLLENGAVGGMDGPGGSTPFVVVNSVTVEPPDATVIVRLAKNIMDDTLRRYGKPTKRFWWPQVGAYGLNIANCKAALANAT